MNREDTSTGMSQMNTESEIYEGGEEYFEGFEYQESDLLYDDSEEAKLKSKMDPNIDPNLQPKEGAFLAPEHEIRAVEKYCDPLQQEAVKIVVQKSRLSSQNAYPACVKLAEQCGYDENQLKRCLKYIRDEAPMIIHFKLDQNDRLEKMYKDTHYRNQFEVKMSNGSYQSDHSSRIGWESKLFDTVYDKAKPFQRPKYGVLNIVNDPAGITSAHHYGDSYFVLKSVRLRASFADQDSGNVNSVTLCSCEYYCHVLQKYNQQEFKSTMQVALGETAYQPSGCISQYKETQLHGEISFAHNVDKVVVNDRHRSDSKMKKLLDKFCEKNNCTWLFVSDLRKELDSVQDALKEEKGKGEN